MNSNTQTVTTLRRTGLNPNAKEFVPTSLRCSSSLTTVAAPEEPKLSESGNTSLDRADCSNSFASDEEYRQYWHSQLPDDILTTDFDFLGQAFEEKSESPNASREFSFDSFNRSSDRSKSIDSVTRDFQREGQQQSIAQATAYGFSDNDASAVSQNADYINEASARVLPHGLLWEHRRAQSLGQLPISGNWNGQLLSGGSDLNYLSELVGKGLALEEEHGDVDPVNLLASEFPGVPHQSLADIYEVNGGDLNRTVEMLSLLKLQEDGGTWRHVSSQPSSSPSLKLDFPSLSTPELVDFSTPVRKNAEHWQNERNGASEFPLGSSRFSSNLNFSSFGGDSGISNEERFEHFPYSRRSHRSPSQSWLETGDAVASIYSELRKEARDHARLRNAYFEQARQAYLIGNKGLAKEASAKGQLHNRLMKAAQSKAGETIFQQRNVSTAQLPTFGPGQPRLLDLHGLHVNEAITLLKRELSALRVAARSSRHRQQVFICVGTGHTKGSRPPARLPLAVERYLAEEEHLHFTVPQAGMIKVVLS